MKTLLTGLLDLYQAALRPILHPACRFHPSCSDYARTALENHGVLSGLGMAFLRVGRCHPFHPGGFDPVPKNG